MERQRPKSTGILTRRARPEATHMTNRCRLSWFSAFKTVRDRLATNEPGDLSARERRRRVADYSRTAAASQNVVISQHPVMGGLHRRCMTDCGAARDHRG